jgi:hypothetical protein
LEVKVFKVSEIKKGIDFYCSTFWKYNAIKRGKNVVVVTQDGSAQLYSLLVLPVVTKVRKDVFQAFFCDQYSVETLIAKVDD